MLQSIIDNWDKLTSLLLSLVAICIALISSWQTSKQANLQIMELQKLAKSNAEDADRQIESIKKMTKEASDGVKKQMIGIRELCIRLLEYGIMNLEDSIRDLTYTINSHKEEREELQKKLDLELSIIEEGSKYDIITHEYIESDLSNLDRDILHLERRYNRLLDIQRELKEMKERIYNEQSAAIEEAIKNGTYDSLYGKEDRYRYYL